MSKLIFDKITICCGAGLMVFLVYVIVALKKNRTCDFMKGAGAFIGATGIINSAHMVATGMAPPDSLRALPDAGELRFELMVGAIGVGWLAVIAVAVAFRDAWTAKAKVSSTNAPDDEQPAA